MGLVIGLILGFVAWAFVHGYLIFVPAPMIAAGTLAVIAAILFMLAIAMIFISAWQGSSVFSPTIDGIVYGFVTAFDILWVIGSLLAGSLPVP
jgi:hypothetical protein